MKHLSFLSVFGGFRGVLMVFGSWFWWCLEVCLVLFDLTKPLSFQSKGWVTSHLFIRLRISVVLSGSFWAHGAEMLRHFSHICLL